MSPAKHRYNANRNENIQGNVKKSSRKSTKESAQTKRNQNSNPTSTTQTNTLIPNVETAFKTFISARFCSAVWAYIADCDETFNYWEPLHYIIYGHGLQTWEYSPEFALRSYTYLMLQGVPGWIYNKVFQPSPITTFYFTRFLLGLGCAVMERYFYKAVCREFGIHIGRIWLIFQLFSTGMFISSTALLPSSFSMYFSNAALAAWWHQKYRLAIFLTAISTLLGWPFAALIGLPIAYDMLIRQKLWKTFLVWSSYSAATILIPMVVIDSTYFGKLAIAPLNIIRYNVFTDHGPNLYGVEPLSYYLLNGLLNFNIIWVFALLTPFMLIIDYFFIPAKSRSTLNYPHWLSLSALYLWLGVFFMQPHKEERFLYPIYPLISLCGAISIDDIQKLFFRVKSILIKKHQNYRTHYLDHTMFITIIILVTSTLLSASRTIALYRNYHAPMDLLLELNTFKDSPQFRNDKIYNVCIGKDWYRFPSSFFFPNNNFRVRFLKSEFNGMLPAYYSEDENATAIIHPYFNDMNRGDEHMYFDYQKCHFLLDLDLNEHTNDNNSKLEPNYVERTKEWTIIKSFRFLNNEKSHRIFRAFYIPFLSENLIKYGNFHLLKRKKFKFS